MSQSLSASVRGTISGPPPGQAQRPAAGRTGLARADVVAYLPGRFTSWAARRSLAPASVTGISVALGICAAAWFSGGTRADNAKAVLALCASYLAAWAAQLLIRPVTGGIGYHPVSTAPAAAGSPRLARLAGAGSEYSIYAGLAVGAHAARWTGAWELATAVMILLSVGQTMRACRGPGAAGLRLRQAVADGGWPMRGPAWADRLVLVAAVAPIWGARMTLLALLCWEIAVICYAMAPRRPGTAGTGQRDAAGHPLSAAGRSPESVARWRDDGRIARWLGRLVRGNLAALPPALAGLAATAVVVLLGLQNLPGLLVLTPVVAMLLAAPGSSYPHIGRLDWLVPAILQAGQFLYVAALGFTCGVPAPLTFALCAMIALRYAALADQGGPGHPDRLERGGGMGWEGRMLVVGLGALAGVTTFAYGALAAYFGVLICSKIMTVSRSEGVSR